MIHPHTELKYINDIIGYGIFATKDIPKGTLIWTLCDLDRVFLEHEIAELSTVYVDLINKFAYLNSLGQVVLCWDHARYMNHSCNPNCYTLGEDNNIAIRDIKAGEEISCDYAQLNEFEESLFECFCDEQACRKWISKKDVLHYGSFWDNLVKQAFAHFPNVQQPLFPFVRDKSYLDLIHPDRENFPKTSQTYYPGNSSINSPRRIKKSA